MTVSQSQFRAALFDPDLAAPPGLSDPQGRPAGKRFNVYRNNVTLSLIEALESSFPVLRKLVGDGFFRAMARLYLRQHPPETPLLMFYGAAMPGFLADFAPVSHLPYLPDVARLELALRLAYHAGDVSPIAPEALTGLPPEVLPLARIGLAPALHLLVSDWPIHAIWRFNTDPDAAKPIMQAEAVVVLRPAFDPAPYLLPPGGAAFVAALQAGLPLGQAADAGSAAPGFDPGATLGLLVQGKAIHQITGVPA